MATPSAQFSQTLRVELPHESGTLGEVTGAIAEVGAAIVAVGTVEAHIPSVFNREVTREVAWAVAEEAERAGPVREATTDTAELTIPS